MDIKIFASKVIDEALSNGFSDAEVYFEKSKGFNTAVFEQEVDRFSSSESMGISLRGILNGKMGYSYSEKFDEEDIDMLIEECRTNAEILESEDAPVIFDPKGRSYISIEGMESNLNEISQVDKIELLKRAEVQAKNIDSRVKTINYNMYVDGTSSVYIKNSKGLDVEFSRSQGYTVFSSVVKDENDTQNSNKFRVFSKFEDIRMDDLVKECVEESLFQLGSVAVKTGKYDVVMRNDVMCDLIDAMAGIFSAEAVDKGLSRLKGKLREKVASSKITLVDNPHLIAGFSSVPFDSEGVPTLEKKIIEKGVLNTYLHDLKTANKAGVDPTGNGFKSGYKSSVSISPTNLYFENGEMSFDDMISHMGDGIIITDLAGLHSGLNSISGDFSLLAKGVKVENGEKVNSVNQITVSGNFFDMINEIKSVANDLEFLGVSGVSSFGSPSMNVGILAISGN
jgi:PmbA protein